MLRGGLHHKRGRSDAKNARSSVESCTVSRPHWHVTARDWFVFNFFFKSDKKTKKKRVLGLMVLLAGLSVKTYHYYDPSTRGLNFQGECAVAFEMILKTMLSWDVLWLLK